MARPLIVTSDDRARDALLRLAAAAGVEAELVDGPTDARRRWLDAPLVVAVADQVPALIAAAMPRRRGVLLLGDDLDDAGVWRRAVQLGAENVVFLPDAEPWLLERFAAAIDPAAEGVTVGVVGGRGGAGASTFAAALTTCAVRLDRSAVLVDGDPLGGGIDLLMGAEDAPGARWPQLARAVDRAAGAGVSTLLPSVARVPLLSCSRDQDGDVAPGAVTTVLGALRRECDLLVVDLPRRVDAGVLELLTALDRLVVVVPADVRGVAASAQVAAAASAYVDDIRVVVRRPSSGGIDPAFVAATLGLPLAGHCKPDRSVAADADRGLPPASGGRGHLARLCTAVVRDLVRLSDERRMPAA